MKSEEKKFKYGYIAIKSTRVGRALDSVRTLYQREGEPNYLVIPYVLTCSAFLESKLNDSLMDAKEYLGDDVSSALMSSSLPNKLKILVPVLTDGMYEINKEHFVFQRLMALIRVRNAITHAKSELKEFSLSEEEEAQTPLRTPGFIEIPERFKSERDDVTLGANKTFTPLEFHEALDKLDRWFFRRCPDRLSKVAMVVARDGKPHWEEVQTTLVKNLD